MSKARDIADSNFDTSGFVTNDTGGDPNLLPVLNFVYGAEDVAPTLPEGNVYIKATTGV